MNLNSGIRIRETAPVLREKSEGSGLNISIPEPQLIKSQPVILTNGVNGVTPMGEHALNGLVAATGDLVKLLHSIWIMASSASTELLFAKEHKKTRSSWHLAVSGDR